MNFTKISRKVVLDGLSHAKSKYIGGVLANVDNLETLLETNSFITEIVSGENNKFFPFSLEVFIQFNHYTSSEEREQLVMYYSEKFHIGNRDLVYILYGSGVKNHNELIKMLNDSF